MAEGRGKTKKAPTKAPRLALDKPDKTVLKSLALGGLLGGGGECVVDVKDGKAVRIRPFHYDWKYDKKNFNAWKMKRNGATLEPLIKALPGIFSWAIRKRHF